MFFCETCQVARGWPQSITRSFGRCECCGRRTACYDVPARFLDGNPTPKRVTKSWRRRFRSSEPKDS